MDQIGELGHIFPALDGSCTEGVVSSSCRWRMMHFNDRTAKKYHVVDSNFDFDFDFGHEPNTSEIFTSSRDT